MPRFKVGDAVKVPGFEPPYHVIEVWPGKKNRYLLGVPIKNIYTEGYLDGIFQVGLVVEESKLQDSDFTSELQ